jgi:hypothetical protein
MGPTNTIVVWLFILAIVFVVLRGTAGTYLSALGI